MIEVQGLTKNYGNNLAVDHVSFTVRENEVLGFLGPNGAGKSTIMNILTGYISASAGQVSVAGADILENPAAARQKIGYLPEHPPLYPDMTVREYLNFAFGLKKCRLDRRKHLDEVSQKAGVLHVSDRLIKNLSKGYQQRVGLAQALINDPPILILDEPTVGFDPAQIIEIRKLLKQLGQKHTVILSSHILSEVQSTCSRIIVINKGNVIADDTTESLTARFAGGHNLRAQIVGDRAAVAAAIRQLPGVRDVKLVKGSDNEYIIDADPAADIRIDLFKKLAAEMLPLIGLRTYDISLEQIFMRLITEEQAPDRAFREVK